MFFPTFEAQHDSCSNASIESVRSQYTRVVNLAYEMSRSHNNSQEVMSNVCSCVCESYKTSYRRVCLIMCLLAGLVYHPVIQMQAPQMTQPVPVAVTCSPIHQTIPRSELGTQTSIDTLRVKAKEHAATIGVHQVKTQE